MKLQFIIGILLLLNVIYGGKHSDIVLISSDEEPMKLSFKSGEEHDFSFFSYADQSMAITYNDVDVLRYNMTEAVLASSYNFEIEGDIGFIGKNNKITVAGVSQWKLIVYEDFQGERSGWNLDKVGSCPGTENVFLGGHCNFASQEVSKTFADIPLHSMIMIKFNFHFIDEWNGESAIVKMNNEIIWAETYSWCESLMPWSCVKYGINACGNSHPDRMAKPLTFIFEHTEAELTLTFTSTLKKNACQASWGVDDIELYII